MAASTTAFTFFGPLATLTVSTGDRVLVQGSAALGVGTGTAEVPVDLDVCYRLSGGGTTEVGFNYMNVPIPVSRKVVSSNNIFSGLTNGLYTFGMCFRNGSATTLTGNDWVQGYAMILK
jgi:hypothetical protein